MEFPVTAGGLAKCITKPDQIPYTLANTMYYSTIILY